MNRKFAGLCLFFSIIQLSLFAQQSLPKWQKGMMDIHHISTGRGNAVFMVFPDGTTMLYDAGEISNTHPRTLSDRNSMMYPDSSRPTYEWIINYIQQFSPNSPSPVIDYGVISHFHDDHFGEWDPFKKRSKKGNYVLTGFTGIGDSFSIRKMLDRGHNWPIDLRSTSFQRDNENDEYHIVQTLNNYFSFLDAQKKRGMIYDSIIVGATDQFKLLNSPNEFPNWRIQNIAAGGKVATGYSNRESINIFQGNYPGENPISVCLKISYGKFDYFTGGDISGIDETGAPDPRSAEAHVAPVIGAVDVATLNHHGNRDSQHGNYVRSLRPRVWIQQTWSSDHPGNDVLRRIMNTNLYPGPRDLFATDMLPANINVIGDPLVNRAYQGKSGHIVVRVQPGGDSYMVYMLNNKDTKRNILTQHGPYSSR